MFGLFESETIVSVSTSVSRVIEDRLVPNSIKTGTIKGLLTGNGDQLVENIMEDVISSIGAKGERLYRYGKNGYPYGAPTSRVYKSSSTDAIAKAVIQTKVGYEPTMEYVKYGTLNRQHYGWQALCDSYGYNPRTNELTTLSTTKGFPVYLEDMQVVVPQEKLATLSGTAFEQWGVAASSGYTPLRPYGIASQKQTPIGVDTLATQDYLKVSIIWKEGATIKRDTFNISMPVAEETAEYVLAKYTYQAEAYRTYAPDPRGVMYPQIETIHYNYFTEYFTYKIKSGTYPDLDNLFTSEFDDLGSFFPFGYLRLNKQPTSTDKNSTEYKALTKMMGYLNLNYAQINAAVNANPQINDVDSALLMMMVPAVSADHMENRYLFDFFKGLYVQTGSIAIPEAPEEPYSGQNLKLFKLTNKDKMAEARISLVIKDARFSTSLGMTGIYRRIVSGVLGKVGTYSSGKVIETTVHNGIAYGEPDSEGKPTETPVTWTTEEPYHYYCKQITEYLYEEIKVGSLRMTYQVDGSHATTNQMVPLDHAITEHYSMPDREHLYARSLHYVFNARKETTLKWYQQDWFGTLLIIIAVVWTIFSLGSDGGSGLAAAIAAGTATLEMIVIAIIVTAIEAIIIKMVAKLFVKLLGAEFALLVAVVAAAYGMYASYGTAGGVSGAPWAQDLLSVSSSMISEVSAGYQKDMELLKKDEDEFNLFAKTKMDELEKVREEMEGSHLLSPFILFGESPTNYFNRTVHVGNIGVQGIEAISNYCTVALTLPTFEQTFGMA